MTNEIQIPDNLSEIAMIIRKDWTNIYFAAKPYLDAMKSINSIHDRYLEDSAADIIAYFLGNAQFWRGSTARAVKAKLNALLRSVKLAAK